MHFSIYIIVLMSNTLDGQINTYLTAWMSIWLKSWGWIDFQKQNCLYWKKKLLSFFWSSLIALGI